MVQELLPLISIPNDLNSVSLIVLFSFVILLIDTSLMSEYNVTYQLSSMQFCNLTVHSVIDKTCCEKNYSYLCLVHKGYVILIVF